VAENAVHNYKFAHLPRVQARPEEKIGLLLTPVGSPKRKHGTG